MKPVFQWVYAQQPQSTAAPVMKPASAAGISDRIGQAFDAASAATGTSFDYLLKTAERESSMNPSAKAQTSSAVGLFQFIESTWLETLKLSGKELGLGAYADKIEIGKNGRYHVADPEARREILALRSDPEISALIAGALTRQNAAYLRAKLGREPSAGELYIAHFLGAGGAKSFIRLAESSPDAPAAAHFPSQAAANRSIFYRNGEALSASAVYAKLVKTHGDVELTPFQTDVALAYGGKEESKAAPSPDPESRISAGWRAAAAADAFSGFFRNDADPGGLPAPASFWQGYIVAPALFDVAVAEDAKTLAAEENRALQATSPSLVTRAGTGAKRGPLDLSRFLQIDEG